MMFKRNQGKAFLAMAFAAALVGCGDDNGGTTTGDLNQEQSAAVNSTISNVLSTALSQGLAGGKLDPRRAFTASVEVSVPCSAGGTAGVTGSVDATATGESPSFTYDFTYEFAFDFNECAGTGDDGVTYALTGTVNLGGDGNWNYTTNGEGADTTITLDGSQSTTMTGSIGVSGGDLDVSSCDIDMTTNSSMSGTSPNFTGTSSWEGSICGGTSSGEVTF